MRLQELFRPEDLLLGFHASDKWDAIDRMMSHLAETGRVPPALAPDLHEAVLARERSMSTGMEHGVAIPHAAVEGLEEVAACLAVVGREEGLSFDSIDARPAHFIVLLLIPRAHKLLHIRTLADVARVLNREPVREALLDAEEPREAWNALADGG